MASALSARSALKPGTNYPVTRDPDSSHRSLTVVKLTDVFLTALNEFQSSKGKKKSLALRFKPDKTGGIIRFHGTKSDREFEFDFRPDGGADRAGQSSFDCIVHRPRKRSCSMMGALVPKMTVRGSADSYQTTRKRVQQAAEEMKNKNTPKEIEVRKAKGGGSSSSTRSGGRMRGNARLSRGTPSRLTTTAAVAGHRTVAAAVRVSKPLRSRILHLLGLRPCGKVELMARLEKDSKERMQKIDMQKIDSILEEVAELKDGKYQLQDGLISELEIETWPFYTEQEKQLMRRIIIAKRNLRVSPSKSSVPQQAATAIPSTVVKSVSRENSPAAPPKPKPKPKSKPSQNDVKPLKKEPETQSENKCRKRPSAVPASSRIERAKQPKIDERREAKAIVKVKRPGDDAAKRQRKKSENGDSLKSPPVKAAKKRKLKEEEEPAESPPEAASSTSVMPDYMNTYTTITSHEQRTRYKNDFNLEYPKYLELQKKVSGVESRFADLKEQRKQCKKGTPEFKKIERKIMEEYDVLANEKYQEASSEVKILHEKLSHIKKLIVEYDAK
ncbi:RNA polymerase II elongation factor ELL-like [Oscarella lobularis]|uniref:RNA polymerase II elongation factor ELL-like n=1 Tax=Oscarella lobularis TaxID=121494 RepID=UPI003313E858